MTELPKGFDYQGVYCYPSPDDATTFYYLPGQPAPRRGADGSPSASLIVSGGFAFLQLTTDWSAPSALLEGLRAYLERKRDVQRGSVRLAFAPVTVSAAKLTLSNADGTVTDLQTSTSSGMPPFTAAFNAQLTAGQKEQAAAAFAGKANVLKVLYQAALAIPQSAEATISGDVRDDLALLDRPVTLEAATAAIDRALDHGTLRLVAPAADAAPANLVQRVSRLARARAAELLQQLSAGDVRDVDVADFQASATATEPAALALERATDVSSWFADGRGGDHVKMIS
jgi:hypothetical protein